MGRALSILFLIAQIVVCPLQCAGCFAADGDADQVSRASCSCCSHRDSLPESRPGSDSHDTEDCVPCLCDGAILANGGNVTDLDAEAWVGAMTLSMTLRSGRLRALSVLSAGSSPPRYANGRSLRLAQMSLRN